MRCNSSEAQLCAYDNKSSRKPVQCPAVVDLHTVSEMLGVHPSSAEGEGFVNGHVGHRHRHWMQLAIWYFTELCSS